MKALFVLVGVMMGGIAGAQGLPLGAAVEKDVPRAYLITVGPGEAVYEKFGHNMIWIHLPGAGNDGTRQGDQIRGGAADSEGGARGEGQGGSPQTAGVKEARGGFDIAYNWGMFSFEQENFVWRFIQGRMEYWMDAFETPAILESYKRDDRSIWVQQLNLAPRQVLALFEKLETNRRPENRAYRYDYYRDNCSTRVRDALDAAFGGAIRSATENARTSHSYRWHTRRLMAPNFPMYTALQYVLGHPVDRALNVWEEFFLPVRLMDELRTMTQSGSVQIVSREWQEYQSKRFSERNDPPAWTWIYLALGVGLGAALAACAAAAGRGADGAGGQRGRRGWAISFGILAVAWCALAGAGGAISTWGWLFTDHLVSRYNENWVQCPPLLLAGVVLIPAALRGKRWGKRAALALGGLAAGLSVAGWMLQALPSMNQVNGEIIALALPVNVGLAAGVWRLVARRRAGA